MLNWTGGHEKDEYQGVSSARIGLVGPPGAGATGLVWSLMVNSGRRGSPRPGAGWRLDHHTAAKPTDDDFLSYLTPRRSRQSLEDRQSQGYADQLPREFGHPISDFLVSGLRSGWGSSDHRTTLIKIFDTSMARRRGLGARNEPGWVGHAHDSASHIVLCHPMDWEAQQQSWSDNHFDYGSLLARLVQRCRDAGRGRNALQSLVVAFTRYDLAFLENPDPALLQNPADAQGRLCDELRKCDILREALEELSEFRKLRIVAIPVSTYGFMPDGRANYDSWLRSVEPDAAAAMLTRPDIYCSALAAMHSEGAAEYQRGDDAANSSSKAELDWLLQHWRPFMTADPFVACISSDDNQMIFPISDLLAQISARGAAYG